MRRMVFALSAGLFALALLTSCDSSGGMQRQSSDETPRTDMPGIGDTIARNSDAVTLVSVEATAPPVGLVDPVSEHWVEVVYDLQNRRDWPIEIPFLSASAAIEGVGINEFQNVAIHWDPDAVISSGQMYRETQLKPGSSIRIAVRIPCEVAFSVSGPTQVTCKPYGAPGFEFEITAGQ